MKKLDRSKLKTFAVPGRMEWHGVFTVLAHNEDEARESVRQGLWEDWSPLDLSDWADEGPAKVTDEWEDNDG